MQSCEPCLSETCGRQEDIGVPFGNTVIIINYGADVGGVWTTGLTQGGVVSIDPVLLSDNLLISRNGVEHL